MLSRALQLQLLSAKSRKGTDPHARGGSGPSTLAKPETTETICLPGAQCFRRPYGQPVPPQPPLRNPGSLATVTPLRTSECGRFGRIGCSLYEHPRLKGGETRGEREAPGTTQMVQRQQHMPPHTPTPRPPTAVPQVSTVQANL